MGLEVVIELVSLLVLMSVGQAVLHTASRIGARAARSFAGWLLLFAAAFALFVDPGVVAFLVRLAIVLLAAYALRSVIGGVTDYLRGPQLFETPGKSALAGAVRCQSELPERVCRSVVQSILRRHEPNLALLGLVELKESPAAEEAFSAAWAQSCEQARARTLKFLASPSVERGTSASDARFMAQAMCLYDCAAAELALSNIPGARRGRSWRVKGARALAQSAPPRAQARGLGALQERTHAGAVPESHASMAEIIVPSFGLARFGFRGRAAVLGLVELALVIYGVYALTAHRGVWLVFLAVAVWLHVHALFALRDFAYVAASQAASEPQQRG